MYDYTEMCIKGEYTMDKREAREILFTLVYEYEFNPDKSASDIYDNARADRGFENFRYIKKGLVDIIAKRDFLASVVEKYSNNWKITRIAPVTRSLLFVAAYDMVIKTTPVGIAINEVLELAKKYDTEQSVSFINGILNSISDNIDEIKASLESEVAEPSDTAENEE